MLDCKRSYSSDRMPGQLSIEQVASEKSGGEFLVKARAAVLELSITDSNERAYPLL